MATPIFPDNDGRSLAHIISGLIDLIWTALPVLISLSFLVFGWGVVKFIYKAGSDADIKEGKQLMVWGLIAFFCLFSFMGIIAFFSKDIGFGDVQFPFLPTS